MNPTRSGRFFVVLAFLALGSSLHVTGLEQPAVAGFRALAPVYRFWSPAIGRHFYTIDGAERDRLVSEYPPSVWTFEGIAYHTYARDTEAGLMPVYRFWSPATGGHFFTISEAERDKLISEYPPSIWTFEGTAFYAYPSGGQPARASAVYRFWSPVSSGHFYTMDEAERDRLIKEQAGTWIPEDVAWYAFKDAGGIGPTPTTSGKYEFSGGEENILCTLTLKAYINGLEATIDNSRLTFAPENAYMRLAVDFNDLTTTIEEVLVESKTLQHTTTIRGGAQGNTVIPLTVSGSVIFWAATPRGPYRVNPLVLAFPGSKMTLNGENETFTLTGSATVNGTRHTISQAVRATRFSEGRGQFDDDANARGAERRYDRAVPVGAKPAGRSCAPDHGPGQRASTGHFRGPDPDGRRLAGRTCQVATDAMGLCWAGRSGGDERA